MNAAARLVHQNILSRRIAWAKLFSGEQLVLCLLSFGILFSALAIIYTTHHNRILHATIAQNLLEQNRLQVKKSQLLLERSSMMMQTQIQTIAEKELGMILPDSKSVVTIHE